MNLSLHGVMSIELVKSFPKNGNSRTIRIKHQVSGHRDLTSELEIVVYGATEAFDLLPRSDDFRHVDELGSIVEEAA